MTFLTQIKVKVIRKKREKIAKIGAIDKTAFPIQGLYQRSGWGCIAPHFELENLLHNLFLENCRKGLLIDRPLLKEKAKEN